MRPSPTPTTSPTGRAPSGLVNSAIEAFGDLDILVNNAGILRDRVIVNMTEAEWDAVIAVHLKGHFAPSRWAAAYWREEHKAGRGKRRNLVHTSSTSGLFSNPGQANYGAAKSGIATFSQIAAKELTRYDVISNCIAPGARTRLTLATPGLDDIMAPKEGAFDEWDPANISPLVAYLATADCPFTGETFFVQGGVVKRVQSWEMAETVEQQAEVDRRRASPRPSAARPADARTASWCAVGARHRRDKWSGYSVMALISSEILSVTSSAGSRSASPSASSCRPAP